jgi:hypothetical protein
LYLYTQNHSNSESLLLCFSSSLNKLNFMLASYTKAIKGCNTIIRVIQTKLNYCINPPSYYMLTTMRQMITHIWESRRWQDVHGNLSCWRNSHTNPTAPKGLPSQSPIRLNDLWVLSQFLSSNSHWSSRLKSIIGWQTYYIDLLDPYLQYVISIFNTC